MTRVEILRLNPNGSQEVLATGKLSDDKKIEFEGNPEFIEALTTNGVLDKSTNPPQRLYPTDGENFLRALEPALSSGYLAVKETKEE